MATKQNTPIVIQKEKIKNRIAGSINGWFDFSSLATAYFTFLKENWHVFLESTLKYILFPVMAAASVVNAILAWRHAHLERDRNKELKNRNIFTAVVETLAALAITIAVIGSLAFAPVFGFISPVMFAATLGTKAVINACKAVYNLYKGLTLNQEGLSKDEFDNKQSKYFTRAKESTVGFVLTSLATAASTCVFIFAQVALAPIGIAAGILGSIVMAVGLALGVADYLEQRDQEKARKQNISAAIEDKSESEEQFLGTYAQIQQNQTYSKTNELTSEGQTPDTLAIHPAFRAGLSVMVPWSNDGKSINISKHALVPAATAKTLRFHRTPNVDNTAIQDQDKSTTVRYRKRSFSTS